MSDTKLRNLIELAFPTGSPLKSQLPNQLSSSLPTIPSPRSITNDRSSHALHASAPLSSSLAAAPVSQPFAYADTGATDHFFTNTMPVLHKLPSSHPIQVTMANGTSVESTHTAMLPHTNLPSTTRTGHILPSLTTPLLSISKFCDAGYRAVFDATQVVIHDPQSDRPLLSGHRSPNGLWKIPIPCAATTPGPPRVVCAADIPEPPRVIHAQDSQPGTLSTAAANFTIHDTTVRQAVKYLHLCLFSPTKSTLLSAIRNNHFVGWPALTADAVQRHLQLTVPTILGHMDQQRQHVRSTRRPTPSATSTVLPPPRGNQYAALADEVDHDTTITADEHTRTHLAFLSIQDVPTGMVYSDQTGNFPITSSRGACAAIGQ